MKILQLNGKELFRVLGKNKANIKAIEKELDVKIDASDSGEITINSEDSYKEYLCLEIIRAVSLGFNIETALSLKNEDFMFKTIPLKNIVKKSRIGPIKGRIIGTEGKSKRVVEDLTETAIAVGDNVVGIIGSSQNVEIANAAIDMLIHGAPHAIVYKHLEKSRSKIDEELPLREIIREDFLNPKKKKPKKKVKRKKLIKEKISKKAVKK